MSLGVYWDGEQVGLLEPADERSRDYTFAYTDRSRPISLALPVDQESFTPAESRPFFEALLPEGSVREQLAQQLKLAASDTYGLLAELGRDCAGALQIVESKRMSEPPEVRWLTPAELDERIEDLPRHPLGIRVEDGRLRLSLAGVQRKAVLIREGADRYGEPLHGMPSTHILKPDSADSEYPGLAANEYFCMRLAGRCGLPVASVELISAAGRPCLVVERFDRDLSASPVKRLHQEDLCQALGLTPDFKYQKEGWRLPSYAALGDLLDEHGERPGNDRLAAARAAVFHYLVGNADAHAKNISLLHSPSGVRLAPLYDVVSTAAYPELSPELALSIGDELDPEAIGAAQWVDLAADLRLQPRAFERERARLVAEVGLEAAQLENEARAAGWNEDVIARTLEVIAARAARAK